MLNPAIIVHRLSDQQLAQAVCELFEWENTGILKDGVVRSFASQLRQSDEVPHRTLSIASTEIYHESARRFIASVRAGQIERRPTNHH